jgi:hemolysin III
MSEAPASGPKTENETGPSSGGWLERHISLHSHDSHKEETASALTHALGLVLSLGAAVLLLRKAVSAASSLVLTGYGIYLFSMTLLYLSSTLYHFSRPSNLKRVLRIADHMSIYLLIAGTYTAVLVHVQGPEALLVLRLVWLTALGGMIFKIVFWGRFRLFQVLLYILMGWLIVLVWKPVVVQLPREFFAMILAGGIVYTSGTIVYAMKKLPFSHALWHLFVLGGSICFFLGIYLYL